MIAALRHRWRGLATTLVGMIACAIVGVLGVVIACANPGPPPGGPERHTPPRIVKIDPDTNATHVKPRDVRVTFDEVIAEKPSNSNATQLSDLVVISPRNGDVEVGWHHSNITIRPHKGWLPNTTYTVTIAPGIADLHGNIMHRPTVLIFSTGDSVVHSEIRGVVFDWLQGKPVYHAVVEAVPRPDSSVIYMALTDSVGRFTIRAPQAAAYTVRASVNNTPEHVFDARMPYDTVRLALQDTAHVELLAYSHDSLGPVMTGVQPIDSVTLRASFGAPIAPSSPLDTSQFTLLTSDSVRIPIKSVHAPSAEDSVKDTTKKADTTKHPDILVQVDTNYTIDTSFHVDSMNRADTIRKIDTTRHITTTRTKIQIKPTKPLLFREVLIKLGTPVRPKSTYRLSAKNLVGPNGVKSSSEQSFTTPAPPPPPDSTKKGKGKAAADTSKSRPPSHATADTSKTTSPPHAVADTAHAPSGPPKPSPSPSTPK